MENKDREILNNEIGVEALEPVEVKLDRKEKTAFQSASMRLHKFHKELNKTMTLQFCLFIIGAVLAALAIREFVCEPTRVDGTSMQYTLLNNERVFVEKISYLFHEPRRGDIVIVHYPGRNERFVKRVIALGGETISIDGGYVYINGERLDESAYAGDWYGTFQVGINTRGSKYGSYTVPEGYVFVMGDNRNGSKDSRFADVGPIALDQVIGHVVSVIWPISNIRGVTK